MAPKSIREFCWQVLARGTLESKLATPRLPDGQPLSDALREESASLARPARAAADFCAGRALPLPRPGELGDPSARARCLARFAHHELQAIELLAWALLRWPALPDEIRRGFLLVLEDEQRHCRLYLERLAAHGSKLSEHAESLYFWRQVPAIAASPEGPRAFLAALGLTLEQANLDFSALYRDAFREAGDEASALVCAQVHADERGHVSRARRWLLALSEPGARDLDAYIESVPFPLGPARAKGRRFELAARRAAGLSEALIDHVREARSSQELAGRRNP